MKKIIKCLTLTTEGIGTMLKHHANTPMGDKIREVTGGWFDAIPLPDYQCVMYVHDEGHLINLPLNPIATALAGRLVAGDVVIVGTHDRNGYHDGENHSVTYTLLSAVASQQKIILMRLQAEMQNAS
jgi:hypothetical protein